MSVEAPEPPDTVIFDLGGVLISWDPARAFDGVLDPDAVHTFLADIEFAAVNRGLDAGRPFAEVVAEVDDRFPAHAGRLAAYAANFDATLTGLVPGTARIVDDLAEAGVRLLALTNWSAETFPRALNRFEVLRRFEGIVVSGAERLVKPDPRLYQVLFDRYDVTPGRTVFVDDAPANVTAAAELGLIAVRFTDATELRATLVGLGLPLPPRP